MLLIRGYRANLLRDCVGIPGRGDVSRGRRVGIRRLEPVWELRSGGGGSGETCGGGARRVLEVRRAATSGRQRRRRHGQRHAWRRARRRRGEVRGRVDVLRQPAMEETPVMLGWERNALGWFNAFFFCISLAV